MVVKPSSTKAERTMTNHTGRLYALAASLAAFFILWAAIAAHPWKPAASDPRLAALAQREQLLRRDAKLVRQIVQRRAGAAAARAKASSAAAAAPPTVRVVTLPPLVITRTS
jgi:hypothetical protein